jgi:ADP-heptose:LPS heptosyltransferase
LIDVLAEARVCVGGDTGPLHLASLLGTPVVQILGPTHPVQNEPWPGTPSARAHLPLPCSPCRRGCDAAPCMQQLPASDVIVAARRVLAESSRRGGDASGGARAASGSGSAPGAAGPSAPGVARAAAESRA